MAFPVDLRRCQALGLAGSAFLALGGETAGALPVQELLSPTSGRGALGLVGVYFGVVLLIAAWALLGKVIRGPEPPAPRALLLVLAVWAAPLLLAPPLFSRDVYSYLAQGAMVDAHMDVYLHGPARLGGPLADEVAPMWRHTATPYGPVFLAVASGLSGLTEGRIPAGLIGMRVIALLGVALMAAALPRLARHGGADPAVAVWLGALNPLVLLHLVAGAHNDALMLGLLGVGLVLARGRWYLLGVVLVTLAALVKAPAALGLAALVMMRGRTGRVRTTVTALAVATATTAAVTALAGTGYGWIAALRTPVSPQNWSPTSVLGRATGTLLHGLGSDLAPLALPAWRAAGLLLTLAVVLFVWLRLRPGPVYALGLSLAAVAALGPAIRPWYALWGLFLIAAAARSVLVQRRVAVASGMLALAVLPSGDPADTAQVVLAVCGGVLAVVVLWQAEQASRAPALERTA
ncbi:polyprenol phosphomannose-dependent alpha 1,6 mannosyltransferase MptB [Streptomyces europaeiscabiei]|uniref:polyprenol phosphomannose-dependent alpha 1,6 mannosyltransferase MptB n=1 Tax=Streptomyces europaeiscabiei TaxID=146819 RepID=UPI0029BC9CEE|nr:polyprenol phosphomannose-dependent alpha 1,6 mannosyltransferase MptB [Streptomyces europaeiscabiei]MDX2764095.1 polyprenol phosphomannose-dependent alpha 1,6 mannosyltransferase MptB [Streptomyces europaeiscabiei]MDX2771306.1 polyprenol phosphomannose-dependent alpha 1,6 mannosyltransferase MptB [Streptomyces europaeiscabiei]MDX3713113.1 polyprenol phosphomannose-dependent alpha 1,6 mannosyltransferase MptB [Streptomyces europaeiscabiei]MDX3782650.1 polyprenol phosphomannose-dependent alph